MVETSLYYRIPQGFSEGSESLESIVELTSRLKEAREKAEARSFGVDLLVSPLAGTYYKVSMTAPDKVKLQDCLREFLTFGGLPSCIHGELKLAEELLVPYGKRLRRDLLHPMGRGRSVVDDER